MSALDFDAVVEQLMVVTKCDRAKAERVAIANGHTPPASDPAALAQAARDAAVLEKDEQREVWKRFTVCGFEGWSFSQPRATKQTPGIPDMLFTHRTLAWATFWETKRQVGGRFSEAQERFAASCARAGLPCASGDRYDAERWLVERGLAVIIGGVFEPIRRHACDKSS